MLTKNNGCYNVVGTRADNRGLHEYTECRSPGVRSAGVLKCGVLKCGVLKMRSVENVEKCIFGV